VDKSFLFTEFASLNSIDICKKPPKRERLKASSPMVQFVTPRNRALAQMEIDDLTEHWQAAGDYR
jgi:hypothetical protein